MIKIEKKFSIALHNTRKNVLKYEFSPKFGVKFFKK